MNNEQTYSQEEMAAIAGADQWKDNEPKKSEGRLVKLPSGRKVFLRPVDIQPWVRTGHLPLRFMQAAMEAAAELDEAKKEMRERTLQEEVNSLSIEQKEQILYCQATVIEQAMVFPRIVADRPPKGNGEISPVSLSDEDGNFIFFWASGGNQADSLEHFRSKSRKSANNRKGGKKRRKKHRKRA